VAYFVQSAGIIVMGKDNLSATIVVICRHVLGFFAAFDQKCPEGLPEQVIEQHDKIIRVVSHGTAIVRLSRG
jgi:hypothetical protein